MLRWLGRIKTNSLKFLMYMVLPVFVLIDLRGGKIVSIEIPCFPVSLGLRF